MPTTICFANMKGGVGKTTLCVNLAFELFSTFDKRVLIIDNDPQFNATSALVNPQNYIDEYIKNKTHSSIYDIYEKPPRIMGQKTRKLKPETFFKTTWYRSAEPDICLDLIASRIELYETLKNPSQKEYLLDKFLERHATSYDYILIDCPPTPSVLTLSAFASSDYILIPVTPDYFATMGLPQFLGTLLDFKADLQDPHDVTTLGVIFTNVERRPSQSTLQSMDRVRQVLKDDPLLKIPVFNSKTTHLTVYKKTLWQSVPVHKIAGQGIRGRGTAIKELNNIAKEMEGKIAKLER